MATSKAVGVKYIGRQLEFVQGIPAKDMTAEQCEKYGGIDRVLAFKSVYQPVYAKKKKTSAKAEAEQEGG